MNILVGQVGNNSYKKKNTKKAESFIIVNTDKYGGSHAGTLKAELIQVAAVVVQWIERLEKE